MKRITTLLVVLLALTSTSFAKVRYGIEGGAYINKMKFNKDIVDTENRAGFFIGGKLKGSLPLGFGVDAALLYSNRSAGFETDNFDDNVKALHYLTIPVNVRWQLGSDRFAPYIATGPQWDFLMSDNKINFKNGFDDLKASFERNVVSWNIGLGLMLIDHVQVGFNWNFPITNSGKISKQVLGAVTDKSKIKNSEWAIRVNYYF